MRKIDTGILKLPRFGAEVLSVDRAFRSSPSWRLLSASLAALIAALVLGGYAMQYERAWRLTAGLPAIHPSTALCILLLALGLLPQRSLLAQRSSAWRLA